MCLVLFFLCLLLLALRPCPKMYSRCHFFLTRPCFAAKMKRHVGAIDADLGSVQDDEQSERARKAAEARWRGGAKSTEVSALAVNLFCFARMLTCASLLANVSFELKMRRLFCWRSLCLLLFRRTTTSCRTSATSSVLCSPRLPPIPRRPPPRCRT